MSDKAIPAIPTRRPSIDSRDPRAPVAPAPEFRPAGSNAPRLTSAGSVRFPETRLPLGAPAGPVSPDVLRLMAEGRSNGGIAGQLFVTPKAVEKHIANIFGKLGLHADVSEDHRRVLAVLTYLRSQRDGE